jgi:hypothetical protein
MKTKLTLKIEKAAIETAKDYANRMGKVFPTLSKITSSSLQNAAGKSNPNNYPQGFRD